MSILASNCAFPEGEAGISACIFEVSYRRNCANACAAACGASIPHEDNSQPKVSPWAQYIRCAFSDPCYSKGHDPHSAGDITKSEPKQRNPICGDKTTSSVSKSTCELSSLPVELLDAVYQNLDIEDIFFLGIQSQYFWNVALRHIWTYCTYPCGSWAGQRILCVGDEAESEDVPPNTLSESEEEELRNGFDNDELDDEDKDDPYYTGPINLYRVANARYQTVRAWSEAFPLLMSSPAVLREWSRLPGHFRAQIRADLALCNLSNLYPDEQPWILRNLTTHEYVRSEIFPIMREYIHGPSIDFLGFGEVLLSRTCWGTDGCWPRSQVVGVRHGVWAGHRFDIVPLDKHEQDSSRCTDWKDVSEEVMSEVDQIWFAVTGINWRD